MHGERIQLIQPIQAKQTQDNLAKLINEDFQVRQLAEKELVDLGIAAVPVLRDYLKQPLDTLDQRRAVERIIDKIKANDQTAPRRVGELRALAVLDRRDDSAATKFLRDLASGVADSTLTQEAQRVLARLEKAR